MANLAGSRAFLKKDQRTSGTVYGTHYPIRFTIEQMVSTPVLQAETPGTLRMLVSVSRTPSHPAGWAPQQPACRRNGKISIELAG